MYSRLVCEKFDSVGELELVLRERIKINPRRLDIFSKICLVTGARMNTGNDSNMSLVIHSEKLSPSTVGNLIGDIYKEKRIPSPIDFINVLGTTPGYYLGQFLNIQGEYQFQGMTARTMTNIAIMESVNSKRFDRLYGFIFENELASCWLKIGAGESINFPLDPQLIQHLTYNDLKISLEKIIEISGSDVMIE